jgi:5-methylcytosine-specific restriction endonuclease McrA
MSSKSGNDLFIVDNGDEDWKVLNYLSEWSDISNQFDIATGSIYLETHHVVPLAENGPDHTSNVVAICPKDHRRAHYAAERDEIAIRLTAILDSRVG